MPSFFRFIFAVALTIAVTYAALYTMAVYFEPEPRETRNPIPGIQIRR